MKIFMISIMTGLLLLVSVNSFAEKQSTQNLSKLIEESVQQQKEIEKRLETTLLMEQQMIEAPTFQNNILKTSNQMPPNITTEDYSNFSNSPVYN